MTRRFRPPPLAEFYMAITDDRAAALAEAREQGYAEGHAQGMRKGHAAGLEEGEAKTRDAMMPQIGALRESSARRDKYETVSRALETLMRTREADLAALEANVREVAAGALRTLFPILLSHAVGAEIAALLGSALAERAPETLTLRAHPETMAAVEEDTAALVATGRLILAPDPKRAFAAAEIAWTGGGLTFDPAKLLSQVTAVLSPAVPASETLAMERPAEPHPEPSIEPLVEPSKGPVLMPLFGARTGSPNTALVSAPVFTPVSSTPVSSTPVSSTPVSNGDVVSSENSQP